MDWKRVLMFSGITFALSWTLITVFALSGGEWTGGGAGVVSISVLYMLIPGLVAIGLTKYYDNEPLRPILALYFKPNRWFIAAGAVPIVLILAAAEVGLMLPWHTYDPEMSGFFARMAAQLSPEQLQQMKTVLENLPLSYYKVALIQGLIMGYTVNAVFALGEELGWRGYLQHEMRHLGFWVSSGLIGFIWGLWHAPIVLMGHNFPQHHFAGVGMMIVFAILASPLISYIRLRARTVIGAAIFHGMLNGMGVLSFLYIAGGSDLTAGIMGLAGFIVLAGANVLLFAGERFLADDPFVFVDASKNRDRKGLSPEMPDDVADVSGEQDERTGERG